MRILTIALSAALLAFAAPSVAQAETRLALLIGNEDYPSDPGRLRRPHADVATLRDALERVGFNVTTVFDANARQIEEAVAEFGAALGEAGGEAVGFFYYAGHGAVARAGGDARNFMLPSGVAISSAVEVAQRGVRLDRQIDALENAGASTLFVVYDACRNRLTRGGRGFAAEVQRTGLLVAMSTMADATTPDDGAYAVALAEEIVRPGQRAENAFINASQLVGRGRPNNELPTVSPALRGEFCFNECDVAASVVTSIDDANLERSDSRTEAEAFDAFLRAQLADTPAAYEFYLRHFGDSAYASDARARLEELSAPPSDEQLSAWEDYLRRECVDQELALDVFFRNRTIPSIRTGRTLNLDDEGLFYVSVTNYLQQQNFGNGLFSSMHSSSNRILLTNARAISSGRHHVLIRCIPGIECFSGLSSEFELACRNSTEVAEFLMETVIPAFQRAQ